MLKDNRASGTTEVFNSLIATMNLNDARVDASRQSISPPYGGEYAREVDSTLLEMWHRIKQPG